MISIETVGYYSDAANSQQYPAGFNLLYPSTGNFLAFVGNIASRSLVRRAIKPFRETTALPSEGAALPSWLTGVGWSDQWSFWQEGYPAITVTDTAIFRYPHYHASTDTLDKLDYERMSRVVSGLVKVIEAIANSSE
jgi:hypothetical protein